MAGMSMLDATLMNGGVSNAVRVIEQELAYYKKEYETARGVIEQLHRGFPAPGKPVYIHPADLAEIFDKLRQVDVFTWTNIGAVSEPTHCVVGGVQYIQTTLMPKHTKLFD